MKQFRLFQLIAFVVSTTVFSYCLAVEPGTSAMLLIKKTGMGQNLSSLGYQYAQQTTTYQIIVKNIGAEKARKLLMDEIGTALPKYQDRWDRNLADSYAEIFSPAELESLAEKPRESPYVSKLIAKQGEVGQRMQAKSTDLLKEFLSEALGSAFSKVTPKQ